MWTQSPFFCPLAPMLLSPPRLHPVSMDHSGLFSSMSCQWLFMRIGLFCFSGAWMAGKIFFSSRSFSSSARTPVIVFFEPGSSSSGGCSFPFVTRPTLGIGQAFPSPLSVPLHRRVAHYDCFLSPIRTYLISLLCVCRFRPLFARASPPPSIYRDGQASLLV